MEALKYHLLPERRSMLQNPRTKPRKSTVGSLFVVGGKDTNNGKIIDHLKDTTLGGGAASDGCVLSTALPGGWANLQAIASLWYLGGGKAWFYLGRFPESKNQPTNLKESCSRAF